MIISCQRNAIFMAMMTVSFTLAATEDSPVNITENSLQDQTDNIVVAESDKVHLQPMTILGSQKREFVMDEPMTLQTIGRQALNRIKFTDVDQILNRIPGASLSRNFRFPEGGRGYTIPLIDGVSVRDPYRGSMTQINDTNTFDMDRIEVIKGPASALYWNNAFGGVINVITRDPVEEGKHSLWFEGGTYDRLRGGGSTEGWVGDLGYMLDFNLWDIEGWRQFSEQRRRAVSTKLLYRPDEGSTLTFRGEFLDRYEESPGRLNEQQFRENPRQASPGRAGGPPLLSSFKDTQTGSFFLDYERDMWTDGALKVSYGARRDAGFTLASFSGPSEVELYDMDGKISFDQGLGFMDATLTMGTEIFYGINHDTRFERDSSRSNQKGDNISRKSRIDKLMLAGFAQLQFSPVSWVHITAGGRYENIEQEFDIQEFDTGGSGRPSSSGGSSGRPSSSGGSSGRPTTTRAKAGRQTGTVNVDEIAAKAGIAFDLTEQNKFWFNYSEGLYVPSHTQLFTADNANPDLDPERLTNFEMGMSGLLFDSGLSYNIAYYHADVKDKIVEQVIGKRENNDDIIEYVNANRQVNRGFESMITYQPIEYIRFELTHTYALNEYKDYVAVSRGTPVDYSGNTKAISPEHHFNGRIAVMPLDGLEFEFEVDAITDYHTNDNNDLDPKGKASRPEIFNIRAAYETGPMEFWVHALNITDKKYAERITFSPGRGGRPGSRSIQVGDRFSVYAGIGYNF